MNYFEKRKKELDADFVEITNVGLQKIFNVVAEIQREIQKIQKRWHEIDTEEKTEKTVENTKKEEPPIK